MNATSTCLLQLQRPRQQINPVQGPPCNHAIPVRMQALCWVLYECPETLTQSGSLSLSLFLTHASPVGWPRPQWMKRLAPYCGLSSAGAPSWPKCPRPHRAFVGGWSGELLEFTYCGCANKGRPRSYSSRISHSMLGQDRANVLRPAVLNTGKRHWLVKLAERQAC